MLTCLLATLSLQPPAVADRGAIGRRLAISSFATAAVASLASPLAASAAPPKPKPVWALPKKKDSRPPGANKCKMDKPCADGVASQRRRPCGMRSCLDQSFRASVGWS